MKLLIIAAKFVKRKMNRPTEKKAISDEKFVRRFLSYPTEERNGCKIWLRKTNFGYGRIQYKDFMYRAHRIAFVLNGWKIPKNKVLDHICRVRNCINPAHLRAITNRENILCGIGLTAAFAKQKYCKRQHPLFGKNFLRYKGSRQCRICKRQRLRDYRRALKEDKK